MGKILRVDLTTGSMRDENLPEEPILKKFIGGQSLALYILLKELPLDATPLGPESRIVIMTGPLTGNGFTPGGTKVTAVFLSPLTGSTLGRGATSGYWGTYLKAAGYDGMILTGVAPKPVYLYINQGKGRTARRGKVLGPGHARHGGSLARSSRKAGRKGHVYRPCGRKPQSRGDARQ